MLPFCAAGEGFHTGGCGLQGVQPQDGSHHTLRHSQARGTPDETREFLSPLHCFALWLRAQLESSSKTSGRHPATTKVTAVAIAMAVAAWSGAVQGTGTEGCWTVCLRKVVRGACERFQRVADSLQDAVKVGIRRSLASEQPWAAEGPSVVAVGSDAPFVHGADSAAPAVAPRSARPSVGFFGVGGGCALSVECSSRPQKKGTKHHMKTRPKKTQRWDIKRRPVQYEPLPALPDDWTLVAAGAKEDEVPQDEETPPAAAVEVEVVAAPAAAD